MLILLLAVHILVAISLVGVVLLQKSEGGALGMGGGGMSGVYDRPFDVKSADPGDRDSRRSVHDDERAARRPAQPRARAALDPRTGCSSAGGSGGASAAADCAGGAATADRAPRSLSRVQPYAFLTM